MIHNPNIFALFVFFIGLMSGIGFGVGIGWFRWGQHLFRLLVNFENIFGVGNISPIKSKPTKEKE